jgi:cyclophilin family peptidyl-prolyl cis-trans isomerase
MRRRIGGAIVGIALASVTLGSAARGAEPRLATERVVLRTTLGDLVLAFYPDVAPRHVEQILRLARLGVYDTTHFYRVDPTFIAQISTAQARRRPLTAEQSAAITPIAAEIGDLRHVRGALSMAHDDGKPDSAETSFSILYADAPHLDGSYTVFGRLEAGWEVLDAMAATPRDEQNRPRMPIEVVRAEVVDGREPVVRSVVRVPATVAQTGSSGSAVPAGGEAIDGRPATPFLVLVAVMMVFGTATFLLAGRAPARVVGSLGLLTTLVGGFLLYTSLVPISTTSPWLAVGLLVGSIGLFRLMGWFESGT